jgi:hypothetical protein
LVVAHPATANAAANTPTPTHILAIQTSLILPLPRPFPHKINPESAKKIFADWPASLAESLQKFSSVETKNNGYSLILSLTELLPSCRQAGEKLTSG